MPFISTSLVSITIGFSQTLPMNILTALSSSHRTMWILIHV